MESYKTDQEAFWAGEFGDDYIKRNQGSILLASNLNFFTKALSNSEPLSSCLEFGANIGMNLRALSFLFPNMELKGVEINPTAAKELASYIGLDNVNNLSTYDYNSNEKFDLVLIKGVLIHLNPDMLEQTYQKLYDSSRKYILIAEYYHPAPVAITYRGHADRLFKRDFAGDVLEKFSDLKLVDYGFGYHRDTKFPVDDITWFLLKKNE